MVRAEVVSVKNLEVHEDTRVDGRKEVVYGHVYELQRADLREIPVRRGVFPAMSPII